MLKSFWNDEKAATAIEYGLIASLIAMAIVGGVGAFSNSLEGLWSDNNSGIMQGLNQN